MTPSKMLLVLALVVCQVPQALATESADVLEGANLTQSAECKDNAEDEEEDFHALQVKTTKTQDEGGDANDFNIRCRVGWVASIRQVDEESRACVDNCEHVCKYLEKCVNSYVWRKSQERVMRIACKNEEAFDCAYSEEHRAPCGRLLQHAEDKVGFRIPRSKAELHSYCLEHGEDLDKLGRGIGAPNGTLMTGR